MQSVLGSVIGPKKEIHDLSGRVAIVTGGALGIGYEISRNVALVGCRVIMINRKEDQGKEAIEKIKKETNGEAQVEWIPCDLGNLAEVKKVFSDIREKESRLDLLCFLTTSLLLADLMYCNADALQLFLSTGINSNQFGLDHDGIDRHFGVNWLGHYYVCNLLYPLMCKTSKMPGVPAPRIVFESSEMHRMAPGVVHFGSLDEINDSTLGPMELYGRTKLAMILGAKYGLYERVIKPNSDNIFVISVHPGAVNTDMQEQWKDAYPGLTGKLLTQAMYAIGRDPEQGSFSALYAATSPEIEEKGWNGVYLQDPGKLGKESVQASDPKLGAALWDLSDRLVTEKVGPDALENWNS